MKKLLFFLSLIFLCNIINAQTPMRDVLYLKNGSIIKGTIVEQTPPVQLKIQTSDGSLFVYKYEEILKIEREEAPEIVLQNEPEFKPLDAEEYRSHLGWGINLLGGTIPANTGVIGLDLRYNINSKIALESSLVAVGGMYSYIRKDSSSYPRPPWEGGGIGYNYYYEEDQKIFYEPLLITGVDFFLGEKYNKSKGTGKIIRNGILIRAGTNFSKKHDSKLLIIGWAHETYKRDKPNYSYLYEMGLGIQHEKTAYFYKDASGKQIQTIPVLYLKIHWNQKIF